MKTTPKSSNQFLPLTEESPTNKKTAPKKGPENKNTESSSKLNRTVSQSDNVAPSPEESKAPRSEFAQSVMIPRPENRKESKGITMRRFLAAPAFHLRKKEDAPSSFTAAHDEYSKERNQDSDITERSNGIVDTKTSTTILIHGPNFEPLRRALGTSERQVLFDTITVDTLKKLSELRSEKDELAELIAHLITPKVVYMYVKNDEDISTKRSIADSSPMRMYASGKRITNEEGKAIYKNEMVKVSGAAALATMCLSANESKLFAEIVSVSPVTILSEIAGIPLEGNIFTDKDVLSVLQRLAPLSKKDVTIKREKELGAEGIACILDHYFRFAPVKSLHRHIPRMLIFFRKGTVKRDLLIQNHYKFAAEVGHLVYDSLQIPAGPTDRDELAEEHRNSAVALSDRDIEIIGSQVAHVIGNAFNYATRFSLQLKEDQAAVAAKVKTALDVFKATIGAVATGTSAPPGVSELSGIGASALADMITKWATSPDQALDIESLAHELTTLSNAIRDKSIIGCLVPGQAEWSPVEINDAANSPDENKQRSALERINKGTLLSSSFAKHLENFKQHYLETKLRETTK